MFYTGPIYRQPIYRQWVVRSAENLVFFLIALFFSLQAEAFDELPEAPGRLVGIGAYRLHIQCAGKGRPSVVLEAGLGGSALEWTRIQSELASTYRVCSYDRAGMGWSDPIRGARTSARITEELHQLLQAAGVPGPYLLVGHSFGGYTAQLFASQYPDLTAGVVLVDSSHPEQIRRFAESLRVNIAPKGKLMQLVPVQVARNIPEEVRATAQALVMTSKTRLAVTRELEGFRFSADQVAAAPPITEIPWLVLTRGQQKWPADPLGNRKEALWRQLQTELAAKTVISGQIIAQRSGHHIHLDQPELVVQSIRIVARTVLSSSNNAVRRATMRLGLENAATQFSDAAIFALAPSNRRWLAVHR